MKRFELIIPATVLAMLCLPVTTAAQSADELPPELLACAAETDVARRLECFDREMAKLSEDAEPEAPPAPEPAPEPVVAESVPEPAPEPAPTAMTTESELAAPSAVSDSAPVATSQATAPVAATAAAATSAAESAPRPSPAPEPAPAPEVAPEPDTAADFGLPDEGPNEISAKVTNIMKRPYGELVILLDNGQIWEQKHRDNRFRLDIGDDVTISDGLISGFRLTGGGRNNSIQVERLK